MRSQIHITGERIQKQKFSAKNKTLRFAGLKNAIHPLLLKELTFKTTGELRADGKFPDSGNHLIVANHRCRAASCFLRPFC